MSENGSHRAALPALERANQIIQRCRELAQCTDVPCQTTRTFLGPATRRAHALLRGWMEAAGMSVRVDSAGNLRGLLGDAHAPRLLIGSHLDTIIDAGAFDGVLGVVMGVALAEIFGSNQAEPLPFAIEVIGFSEEEGVRFGKPFIGSLALIGELDAATLALTDADGISVAEAIQAYGLEPANLPAAVVDDSAFAYLEVHIEQGPVLESEDHSLGVVDAIAGQTRMRLTFTGQSNHAGTTPMGSLRHDALAAAAQWIVEVERYANSLPGLVATVGKLDNKSGAGNVIAGEFVATLDVRGPDDAVRAAAIAHYLAAAHTAGSARGVSISWSTSLDQPAVPMDPELTSLLASAAQKITRAPARIMTSGAGHDAMVVARKVPSAMLFLRTPRGLSHHPEEAVLPEDVEAALATGEQFLRRLAESRLVTQAAPVPRARKEAHA